MGSRGDRLRDLRSIVQRPDSLFDPGPAMQLVEDLVASAKRMGHRNSEDYQAAAEVLRLYRHDPNLKIAIREPPKVAITKRKQQHAPQLGFRQQVNIMRNNLLHIIDIEDEDGMRPNRVLDRNAKRCKVHQVDQLNRFKYQMFVASMSKRCYRKAHGIMDRREAGCQPSKANVTKTIFHDMSGLTEKMCYKLTTDLISEPEVKSPRQVQDVNDQLVGEILKRVAEILDKRYMSSESSGDEVQNHPRLNVSGTWAIKDDVDSSLKDLDSSLNDEDMES
ncbi:Hypp2822 [Branchiostoma lanceolatum]|uniref:Hypp2822 protein n=1 Tax=Branchiostoma lanceolatum TaxID=7740 RepID=A0A8J9ZXZ9_BRALA|nr:Hypp2822 [Branchiostoma lanceolatum]